MTHYSEIVSEASPVALQEIADFIVNRLDVRVLKPPAPGMVMVRHSEPLGNTLFLLGETFVTECEVEVDGRLGYGCVLGSEEERALCAALVDAVLGGPASGGDKSLGDHAIGSEIEHLLEAERLRIEARWEAESRAVASTRVSFEVR